MPKECLTRFECQLNDSIVPHFIYGIHCLSTFCNITIMASVAVKHRAENKSSKIVYKALKELEKGTSHRDVSSLYRMPKNTLSPWKKNKDKIVEKDNSGLTSKRVKPEKYEPLKNWVSSRDIKILGWYPAGPVLHHGEKVPL